MSLHERFSSRDNTAYVTYDAVTVSMRDGKGKLVPVREVRASKDGEPHRETWNHFTRSMGALMWESAVEAGFDQPITPSTFGTAAFFTKLAEYLGAHSDKSYVLNFEGLQLHYTALEEQVDAGKRIADANVDTAKAMGDAMFGMWGMQNPVGEAWANSMKAGTKANHAAMKHSIALPLGKDIDLGTAAKHMADMVSMVDKASAFGAPTR